MLSGRLEPNIARIFQAMLNVAFLRKTFGCLVLIVPMVAMAQPLPPAGLVDILKERTQSAEIFNKLLRGEIEYDSKKKEHAQAVDVNARFYAYRVSQPDIQQEPGKLDTVFREYESILRQLRTRPNNAFNTNFLSRILERSKEVLPNAVPVARINAVRMQSMVPVELNTCDILGQRTLPEQLMDNFVNVVEKAPDDGMRLYALKGIRETYRALRPMAVVKKSSDRVFLKPEIETKVAEALVKIIETPKNYAADASPDIIEGYRVLRREAIKGLAQSRVQMPSEKAKTAYLLSKMATGADVKPEPRFDERVEAAIGLLNMRPQQNDANEFNLEADLYAFGVFLVEFFQKFTTRNENDLEKLLPWKIYAARMNDSLDSLKQEVKNPYLDEMFSKVVGGLNDLEKTEKGSVPQLNTFLQAKQPASLLIYKKVAGSEVKALGN